MPFGGLFSMGAGLLSAGSGLAGLFGGSPASKVPTPQLNNYNYANMGGADQNAYGGIGNLSQYNVPAQLLPQYQSIAQSSINNPYAPQYQQGAGAAGQLGMGSGANAYGAGGALTGSALGTLPDVQALMTLGFDPQNALYSKLQQQNSDQTNATNSASGVAGTPYGAGIANQSNQNFNLGWQNNQLGRAATGAGAAGSLLGQAGQGANTGQALQSSAAPQVLAGAGMPYNTFENINADALGVLSGAGQFGTSATQNANTQIQDYLQYLNQGNQANATNNSSQLGLGQFGLNQANQGFQQTQAMGSQIGQGLAGLAKGFGGGGSNPFSSFFGGGMKGFG